MAGDRTIHATCTGAEPTTYQNISGWKFLFDSDEVENGSTSKVFWMGPDMSEKAKKSWAEVLTYMGFDPNGKSAEEWSLIGTKVAGAKVSLVMEMKEKNGKMYERVKYVNVPRSGGEGDVTEASNAAASLFGGAQAKLPLDVPAAQEDTDVPF